MFQSSSQWDSSIHTQCWEKKKKKEDFKLMREWNWLPSQLQQDANLSFTFSFFFFLAHFIFPSLLAECYASKCSSTCWEYNVTVSNSDSYALNPNCCEVFFFLIHHIIQWAFHFPSRSSISHRRGNYRLQFLLCCTLKYPSSDTLYIEVCIHSR